MGGVNTHTSIDMTNGPLASGIVRFAIPVALASTLQQLFNSADIAVVGHFCGKAAMAAVNSSVINLQVSLFSGLAIGVNVVIAQAIGKNDPQKTQKGVHTAISLGLVSGLLLACLGFFTARPLLTMMQAPMDVLDLAVLYLRIYFGGMPALMLYNFAAAVLRSCGDTKRPLIVLLFSGIINVLLNLLFVIGFGWAVAGVALATVISNASSALTLLWLLHREQGATRLRFHHLTVNPSLLWEMIRIGLPAGLQSTIFSFSNVVIQSGFNSFGSACIAGNSIGLTYESYTNYMTNGFAQAAMTFSSQNYGARRPERCRKVMRLSILLGMLCVGVMCFLSSLCAIPLCRIYSPDPEVITYAVWRINYAQRFQWIAVIYNVGSGMLRSIGYSIIPTIISIFGVCIFRLFWIATAFAAFPTYPVLASVYPITWSLTSALMMGAYFLVATRLWRKLKEKPRD